MAALLFNCDGEWAIHLSSTLPVNQPRKQDAQDAQDAQFYGPCFQVHQFKVRLSITPYLLWLSDHLAERKQK